MDGDESDAAGARAPAPAARLSGPRRYAAVGVLILVVLLIIVFLARRRRRAPGPPVGPACSTSADCAQTPQTPFCGSNGKCRGCVTGDCSGATPFCDADPSSPTYGACRSCVASDCSGHTPVCDKTAGSKTQGTCVACGGDSDCSTVQSGTTPFCRPDGSCESCDPSGADCGGSTPFCETDPTSPAYGNCRSCVANGVDCTGTTPICDTDPKSHTVGACRGCEIGECPAGSVCHTADGSCGGCLTSADCYGQTPACNVSTGQCSPCGLTGFACPAGTVCQKNGSCSCTTDADCQTDPGTAAPYCNAALGICQPCDSNTSGWCAARSGATAPYCDLSSGWCEPCDIHGVDDAHCPAGSHCLADGGPADGSCVGCASSDQCGADAPYCDPGTHTCAPCVKDSQCPAGLHCAADGRCHTCASDANCDPYSEHCDASTYSCAPGLRACSGPAGSAAGCAGSARCSLSGVCRLPENYLYVPPGASTWGSSDGATAYANASAYASALGGSLGTAYSGGSAIVGDGGRAQWLATASPPVAAKFWAAGDIAGDHTSQLYAYTMVAEDGCGGLPGPSTTPQPAPDYGFAGEGYAYQIGGVAPGDSIAVYGPKPDPTYALTGTLAGGIVHSFYVACAPGDPDSMYFDPGV